MTLSEQVYNQLKHDIQTMNIGANEFLTENSLSVRYSCSKAPVRSALHRLCAEGIIVSHARKGYLVVMLSAKDYESIRELRISNEVLALTLAIERASDSDIHNLLALAQKGRSIRDNFTFHRMLGSLSGNCLLENLLEKLHDLVVRSYYVANFDENNSKLSEDHIKIAQAMQQRDLDNAKKALIIDIG